MDMSLQEIANLLGGELNGDAGDIRIQQLSINTRTLAPGDLYLAIKGAQFDGNAFVEQAAQAGAVAAIVEKEVATSLPYIKVADTRLALKQIAHAWRQRLQAQLVGITGSNGKTTVKEMLASVLAVSAPVLYTQGNLNNDIGVPLTLLRLQPEHRYGVIEMGANHPGEIAYTGSCVQPDVAILNNVGAAHIEGFGSLAGVAQAKSEIISALSAQGTAILNADDAFYDFWRDIAGARKVISFGLSSTATVTARNITSGISGAEFYTRFDLVTPHGEIAIQLKTPGQHNVMNALAVSAAALALGIDLTQIQRGLAAVNPVKGRMQPVVGVQGNLIINDTYNANPSSLKAALDVLMTCNGEPWVALGAFGELGAESWQIHADMGLTLKQMGVVRLWATGEYAKATVETFGAGAQFFAQQADLIAALKQALTKDAVLLCKGSRVQQMEKVVSSLCEATGN